MGTYTIIYLSYNVLKIGFIILALALGYNLTGVLVAIIGSLTISLIVALALIILQIGIQFPTFSNLKRYIRFGIPLTVSPAFGWIVSSIDRYMINSLIGVTSAGIYSAAYNVGRELFIFIWPINSVLFPTVSKSFDDGDLAKTKTYLQYTLKYLVMFTIPAAFGLSILAKPILSILTTSEFLSGSNVIPFIAFCPIFLTLTVIGSNIFNIYYRTAWRSALLGLTAVINIILNLILIPKFGITGAAVATLISYGSQTVMTLLVSRRYMKFSISPLFVLKCLIASSIMTLVIWLIHPESIITVLTSIVLGVVLYFVVLVSVKGFSKGEITFFIKFGKEILKRVQLTKGSLDKQVRE